jgi:hypothetical protein
MTTGGWITLFLSVGFVTGLFVYCVFRVLFGQHPKHELGHIEPLHEDQVDDH